MRLFFRTLILFWVSFISFGKEGIGQKYQSVFEGVPAKKSGITFKNQLKEDQQNNILRYEYFYNGGGVAVGDLNNDGLDDIFFTGNMTGNKLYKNLGELKFEDMTKSAGIAGKDSWTTGVSMADVNGDGLLDIYVCYSGKKLPESRRNELWINEGNFKFSEKAKEYGIDDPSNSTQGLFFDFDNDGDLDLFLLNHHIEVINELEFDRERNARHPYAGDKLYRNEGGKFTDISEQAGIKGSALGFGLAVIASDINQDGWMDLLVTNDYIEPDYLYINKGDGTFEDQLPDHLQHISHFSMGADIADINNDGLPDIFTLDMLPEDNERQKLLYGPENYEQYNLMIRQGFHHQLMRNMLHLNRGNGYFSEVGQALGISNTDWSWSALFFDANNDGNKDLFITNGYYRDYTNRDFLKYKGDYYFKQAIAKEKADTLHLVTSMTSTPIHNYFFENQGNIQFKNLSLASGFSAKNFSSGAGFADLDNDGDLDLVVNHLNQVSEIFENKSSKGNWIQLALKFKGKNLSAIGATVEVYTGSQRFFQELQPVRGFQSSSSYRLHFGLGDQVKIDSILITWPDQKIQKLNSSPVNQLVTIEYQPTESDNQIKWTPIPLFEKQVTNLDFNPSLSSVNDFKRQPLLLTMPSHLGPIMGTADLNSDGNPEVFIGGSKGIPARMYTWKKGDWEVYRGFRSSADFTDAVVVFEDFNRDGALDLFLGSGGYQDYLTSDEALQDRFYLNDGTGVLVPQSSFPKYSISTGTAAVLDVNQDGFPDLFVGGKIIPGRYPEFPESKILVNDGRGNFSDQTSTYLKNPRIGMLTGSAVQDLNGDGNDDLILAGEFMAPKALIQTENGFEESLNYFDSNLSGWWNTMKQADMDGDGDLDLLLGNFGINSQLKASQEFPLSLYAADFDQNGSLDPIFECLIGDGYFPFASRDELLDQMVSMRSKFTDYASYSKAKIPDLFSAQELQNAQKLEIKTLESFYFENIGGEFKAHRLPSEAQYFPVYAIHISDVNEDGRMDVIFGGNQSQARIRIGKIDAGLGLVMVGLGEGQFRPLTPEESGLRIKGDIKSILEIKDGENKSFIFGINQKQPEIYRLK
ncbi:VCBS repeat-containing protein [Algoriphagus sp. AK58]|uniref:VCBS repeat-containing protein n=1 Tax=Algoriphagus sp. AK58 TaxID=1406877 RepID=UPI00164FAF64|nr:VCBS repeat-containing protein [Algoriphagus sp. AK58]MBC6368618.1 RNA-binding protein [Algoriphagus sp. AK58]